MTDSRRFRWGAGLLLIAAALACNLASVGGTPTALPTAIPKPTPTPVERVTVQAAKGEAVSLSLPGGPKVDIPINGLYEDDTATLTFADSLQVEPSNANFRLVGRPFEFEMQSKDTFADVVKLTVPYDPSLLPPDVPEANLFPVALVDNDWVRLRGTVDTETDTVVVDTLRKGVYGLAYSVAPNLEGPSRTYLDALLDQSSAVGAAQSAKSDRFNEWSSRWDGCQFTIEPITTPAAAGQAAIVGGDTPHTVRLRPGDAALKGLAGEPAMLKVGDMTVGQYGGATVPGSAGELTVSELSDENVLEVRCLLLSLESYARFEEASAVVDALEKPERTDFFPDDTGLIGEWVDVQKEVNPDGMDPADWSISRFTDEEIDEAVLGSGDVRVTLTWNNTADLDLAVTDPDGNTIFYGSTTSPSGGELDVDANGYCEAPLTTSPVENIYWPEGGAPEGEYTVQVAYSIQCQGEGSTAYTVLVINGSDVQTYTGSVGGEGDIADVTTFTR